MLRPYGAVHDATHRHPDLLAELSQLLSRRRPVHVRRDESRSLLLELEPPPELRGRRRLPRPLQPDEQYHRWADGGEIETGPGAAEQRRAFVMDHLHHLLAGADRRQLQRADGPFAHPLDESARHLEAHVRLEQVAANLPQGIRDVAFREHPATSEPVQYT